MDSPAGEDLHQSQQGLGGGATAPWWRPVLAALAAAVALGLLVGGAIALFGGDREQPAATGPTPTTAASAATVPSEETAAPGTATGGSGVTGRPTSGNGGGMDLPVYYLSEVSDELRLYREFRAVPDAGGLAQSALAEMLRGQPLDPDYVSLWPPGTRLLDYTVEGDVATVDLSEQARAGNASGGADAAERSLQQLVYTVTAADPRVSRVRLFVGGEPVEELWGSAAGGDEPLSRAPMIDVQGLIWIIDPAQGAETGSPVAVRVFGTAFEGNVVLQVFDRSDEGSEPFETTFVTTGQGAFAEGITEIALPRGSYTIRAYEEHAEEGTLLERDSKDFTVR